MSPLALILLGLVLCLLGVLAPFLMMLGTIPTTFLLGFVSFAMSVAGVLLGIIGGSLYVAQRRANSRLRD